MNYRIILVTADDGDGAYAFVLDPFGEGVQVSFGDAIFSRSLIWAVYKKLI